MEQTHYVVVIKAPEKYFLVLTEDNFIMAFDTKEKAIAYYEDAYRAKQGSYVGSMSAIINWLFFQPSVLVAPDMTEIQKALVSEKATFVRHDSGSFVGAELKEEFGLKWWEMGQKPSLTR